MYIKCKYYFPLYEYCIRVILPILFVTIITVPIPLVCDFLLKDYYCGTIYSMGVSILISVLVIFFVGLSKAEKGYLKSYLVKKH